ncbi:response regulator receiver domain-containing protein [Hoeflea halophila]|uniref:Response regulator receiver domain-containing protein n=1 Tax=Hoeflea halophila TaxID=714899 RepID=A0A286IAU3_9HYPH|nr:response regulator [Hoeflea halophila]SOE17127.1 response regulator receiver domain-containing protein [Hoeflea halophila]
MSDPLKVLYVDDEDDIREIAVMALEFDPGFSVRSCNCGSEALAIAADWLPDLILLDVMMPGMDGPEALQRLRQSAETVSIPVVFTTARTQPEDLAKFMSLGAAGVISKPFEPMSLAEQARDLWERTRG